MSSGQVSITVTDLTVRLPIYGVDSKSLKKHLARVAVGGSLGQAHHGSAEVTAISCLNMKLKAGDIIPINMPKSLDICVEKLPLFRGTFGVSGGHNAIRITEVINREPNTTPRRT